MNLRAKGNRSLACCYVGETIACRCFDVRRADALLKVMPEARGQGRQPGTRPCLPSEVVAGGGVVVSGAPGNGRGRLQKAVRRSSVASCFTIAEPKSMNFIPNARSSGPESGPVDIRGPAQSDGFDRRP